MYTSLHLYMYTSCTYRCIHIYIHIFKYMYIYTYLYPYIYIYICIFTYMYIYIYIDWVVSAFQRVKILVPAHPRHDEPYKQHSETPFEWIFSFCLWTRRWSYETGSQWSLNPGRHPLWRMLCFPAMSCLDTALEVATSLICSSYSRYEAADIHHWSYRIPIPSAVTL